LCDTDGEMHEIKLGDVLFKSAAQCFKERAIAVVLTGGGNDGAKGGQAVKQARGVVIAQNQATSELDV
jgi:two-component system, chemotaxis family, protein-glutamate methylesterase/glutaminase